MLEKTDQIIRLKDYYGLLLTAKQQEIMHMYYEEDWSLAEIAAHLGSSRQAVFDILKRACHSLREYEKCLGLLQKSRRTRNSLEKACALLSQDGDISRRDIDQAAEILKQIAESV